MTRSKYDLFYTEQELGVLNTKAIARTSGSGLYVTITQEHTDSATGEVKTDSVLLFPDMIEKVIVLFTEAKAEAFAVDHTRENVYRIIHEFHGVGAFETEAILDNAKTNGIAVFDSVTQKTLDNPLRYRVINENDERDEYYIELVTSP